MTVNARCLTLSVVAMPTAQGNAVRTEFVWDPTEPVATRPLAMRAKNLGLNLFYSHDGNKNVSEVFYHAPQNGIAAHYDYALFGAVTRTSSATRVTNRDLISENPFRFSSEYHDAPLSLVYYNYRHYQTYVGRWCTREPLEEMASFGIYGFVRNNPIGLIDIYGLVLEITYVTHDGKRETVELKKGGTIDGGSWAITPADKQVVTTSGHTMDDEFQSTGGDASASWSLHYSVTKTSTSSRSGSEGPYSSQAEADAAAASAKASAEAQLRAEAQGMVDRAIATAKSELSSIDFRFDEMIVPVGFEFYDGEHGSKQIISVPMDSSDEYLMRNDEWSLQVNIRKTDSETGETIASDAEYEVFEWDTVTQQYIPFGGYNQYSVARNEDGTYSVANSTDYGTEFDTSRTMYYTQRNEGKFLIVETKAPDGYFGDWTDIEQPGEAGTPLGKRAYYIEITNWNFL